MSDSPIHGSCPSTETPRDQGGLKEWWCARELAAISLPGLPKRGDHIVRRAGREGWACRPRAGRGGGVEYHIDALPPCARDALALRACALMPPAAAAPDGACGAPEGEAAPVVPVKTTAALRRDAAGVVVRIFERWRASAGYTGRDAEERFAALWAAEAVKPGSEIVPLWAAGVVPAFSGRSLRRWRTQAQKQAARQDGRRQARSPFEADSALKGFAVALLLKQPHLGTGHIRDLCRAEFGGEDLPSIRAFQRFLSAWKRDNAAALQKVCAPDAWRSHRLIAVGSASAHVERLNQVWEIDASPADMLCTDGRQSVYALVDVWSRRMLVNVTKTPRTEAVLLLVRRAILEWGVPEVLKTDNGSDFTSRRFMAAVADLGIAQDLCRPFNPQEKPHVERAIGTLQRDLMPTLPGFIGHSVADRKRIEQRKAFGQRLGEGGEKAFSVALDSRALQEHVDAWCARKYAHRPHGGLAGVSPFSKAMSWAAPIRRIESERALDLLLAPIAGQDGFRTVSKKGIRLERGCYFGAGLAGYVGQRVFCRCDPEDLGKIYVFTENMAFVCEAQNIERLGVDRAAAAAQAVADQKRFAREKIDPLRREMKKIDAYSVADTLRDLYARDNGAVSAFPKPSEPHSTPALEAAQEAASPCTPAAMATPEQDEGYRKLLEEYETARDHRPAPPQSDEDRWWARRERLEAALARGEDITPAEARWLENTRNAYWVEARKDFAAFAAQAGGG